MRHTTIILIATLALTSFNAAAQNQIDKQGRRQGHWVRTDKDGSKIFEGDFVDGLETGVFTYYYGNGTVRMRNTYTIPGKRCTHEAYDEEGHLLARGEYSQRNRDGKWSFYAVDGHLLKETTYNMGIKDGPQVVFERNGDTAEVANFSNNRHHGRWWKRIGDNGYITGNYVNGAMEGRLVEYDENGQISREGFYEGGLKHGSYRYFENGRLTIDERWNHGSMNERLILLMTPEEKFVSVFDIACMAAQGKNKVVVFLKDGSRLTDHESADIVYNRVGNEILVSANRKSRVMVARDCVQGIGKDNDGREILIMEPQPEFTVFPDEDGKKMANMRRYDEHSPLEDMLRERQ